MSLLVRSLLYDAVAATVLLVVVLLTSGTVRECAIVLLIVTVLKAPYDAWEARRADRTRG